MLAISEILKETRGARFVPMSHERPLIDDHPPGREHSSGQRNGRGVEQDNVDGIGLRTLCSDAAGLETRQVHVRGLRYEDREVDVAPGRRAASLVSSVPPGTRPCL